MTKKQFGIIFTLLALILCVGVLATKLNKGGLNDPTDLSQVISSENVQGGDKQALSQKDTFYDTRSAREQQDSSTVQTLKALISDQNISKSKKDEAYKELTQKTMEKDKEGRIELSIKNKGYEDALCMLESNKNKATIIVKAANGIQEKDSVAIQEIVQDISNIKDVIIEVQK